MANVRDDDDDDIDDDDDDKSPEAKLQDTDPDGLELEDPTGDPTSQPFRSKDIRIETKPANVDLLVKRLQYGEIDLAPDFQRAGGLWKLGPKSRLIESMLIRIPIPAFYMDATNEERWLVVDGLQRLTVLDEFIVKQSFALTNLEFLHEYNGKRFRDLPRPMQRRIEETQVLVYLIQPGTPPEVKFNIFRRINTGGLPLSPQEIRHALNQGPGAALLHQLAEEPSFQKVAGSSLRNRRMVDRECILRFFAFSLTPPEQYRSDFDSFLNLAMMKLNALDEVSRTEHSRRFVRAMTLAWQVFERDAFRKRYKLKKARLAINKALFEVWSVALADLDDEQSELLVSRRARLASEQMKLLNNDREFEASVTQGTGDPAKVRIRFERIRTLVAQVLR